MQKLYNISEPFSHLTFPSHHEQNFNSGDHIFFLDIIPSVELLRIFLSDNTRKLTVITKRPEIIAVFNTVFDISLSPYSQYHVSIGDKILLEYNISRSAGQIAWEYAFIGPSPWFINYVADELSGQ
jgi:hypothetical protein